MYIYFFSNFQSFPRQDCESRSISTDPTNAPGIDVFRNLRRQIDDSWEVLFMRAEGIHAHGYHDKASSMAVHLANELLKNPPDLMTPLTRVNHSEKSEEISASTGAISKNVNKHQHKKSVKAASHQVTHTASTTLAHSAFLCTVLAEKTQFHHLAFQVQNTF